MRKVFSDVENYDDLVLSTRYRSLSDLAESWQGIVEKILKDKHDISLFIYNGKDKDRERLMLLSLRTWSIKYKLNPEEIIEVLVRFWNNLSKKFSKKRKVKGLGVKINAFCGNRSEEIIEKYIHDKYPNREHLSRWRSAEREKFMKRSRIKTLYQGTIKNFLKEYSLSVEKVRKQNQDSISSGEFKKRRWPGNPWTE